jgi:hypothetical protein
MKKNTDHRHRTALCGDVIMIVKANHIESRLKNAWPDLPAKNIWMTSRQYYVPTVELIKQIVARQPTKHLTFKRGKGECELFSLSLHAAVKTDWLEGTESDQPLAFGEVFGLNMETSRDRVHRMNIAITTESIYLVEPQTYQFIKMIGQNDRNAPNFVFYVTM